MVSAWLAGTGASEWKVRHLLEPICREGRRPSMGTREEYEAMAAAAGFAATGYEDVSRRVARTWRICAGHPPRDPWPTALPAHYCLVCGRLTSLPFLRLGGGLAGAVAHHKSGRNWRAVNVPSLHGAEEHLGAHQRQRGEVLAHGG